jgi:hypothetical protein
VLLAYQLSFLFEINNACWRQLILRSCLTSAEKQAKIDILGCYLPTATLTLAAKVLNNIALFPILLRLLAFLLLIKCPPKQRLYFTFPRAVTLTRFFKPLWVFILGIVSVLCNGFHAKIKTGTLGYL